MKKIYLILAGILVLFILLLIILRGLSGEDSWIKDSDGFWIKHGNPYETPANVLEQQKLIEEALKLYHDKIEEGVDFHVFSSDKQSLGVSLDGNYGFFVVWTPENGKVDMQRYSNLDETGKLKNFVLLDRDGNVVRVV